MTRALALLLLATIPAIAQEIPKSVIRGTVVEASTNKVLARATVTLEPMPGTPGDIRTVRSTRLGAFEFERLPAGVYVLKASRRGYISAEFGQKRWNSAGQPIVLGDDAGIYAPLRLHYFGAISGTIVDENDIGLPGHEVAVFRAVQPPEFIRTGTADDRGVYRISGLDPGRYFIRTVGKQYEEGGYLPTFSHETIRPDQAQVADVFLEQQTDRIDVRPLPGRLFSLHAAASPGWDDTVMTLASGMGRTTVQSSDHVFTGLPPGDYELYAEGGGQGAYQRFQINGNTQASLVWSPGSHVSVRGAPEKDTKLRVRRRDLAGPAPEAVVPIPDAKIFPGRWELLAVPPDGYYATAFSPRPEGRLDGWIEYYVRTTQNAFYVLDGGAASLHGTVKDTPFALVYLEAFDAVSRKRIGDLKVARADARGQYRFANLAPGAYRLLSTFEYLNPSSEIIDTASPISLSVERSSDQTRDLELWGLR
jgi:hypothetical protein